MASLTGRGRKKIRKFKKIGKKPRSIASSRIKAPAAKGRITKVKSKQGTNPSVEKRKKETSGAARIGRLVQELRKLRDSVANKKKKAAGKGKRRRPKKKKR